MVSPTQNPAGLGAAAPVEAATMPHPGPSQAVITRVTNAAEKIASVTAKEPSEAGKQEAALRFITRLQDAGVREQLDEVARETKTPQKAQQLPPQGAMHLLKAIGELGSDMPDWLKDQIITTQGILIQRALIPQVTLMDSEPPSPQLNQLLKEVNKMLEIPWTKVDANAAKEFCGFLAKHPDFIECCDPRSQAVLFSRERKMESKFLVREAEQTLTRCLEDFSSYRALPELTQAPSELGGEALFSYAYTLVAAHKAGFIDFTSFNTKWTDVMAALDTKGLTSKLRYLIAFNLGLMGISGGGYEASKDKESQTSLLHVLEYATRNADSVTV